MSEDSECLQVLLPSVALMVGVAVVLVVTVTGPGGLFEARVRLGLWSLAELILPSTTLRFFFRYLFLII